jgi:hypothetical protein
VTVGPHLLKFESILGEVLSIMNIINLFLGTMPTFSKYKLQRVKLDRNMTVQREAWWLMPIILAIWEVKIGRIMV